MKLPQFTIRDLLLSTALIALGIGAYRAAILMAFNTPLQNQVGFAHLMIAVWLSSGALIGTAIFIPFRRPLYGAIFGLLVSLVLLVLPSIFRA